MSRQIIQRKQAFEVDLDQAFFKLSAYQFADRNPISIWIREAIANALDNQHEGEAIQISLKIVDNLLWLSIHDDGPGFTNEKNRDAYFTLGQSTSRGQEKIGRYGSGIITVYNPKVDLPRTNIIQTRMANDKGEIQPVELSCSFPCSERVPVFEVTWLDNKEIKGFTFSILFENITLYDQIDWDIKSFIRNTLNIQFLYNGKMLINTVENMSHSGLMREHVNEGTEFEIFLKAPSCERDDRITFFVHGIKVEEGSAYHAMICPSGDRMAQNYGNYEHPFSGSEITYINSKVLSPTLSRDAVIRDSQFYAVKSSYQKNMDTDVLHMIEDEQNLYGQREAVISNIKALHLPLRSHFDNNGSYWRESLAPLIEYIKNYKCIQFWSSKKIYSLKDLVEDEEQIFFYTNSMTTYEHFSRIVLKPILRENVIAQNSHFGYHRFTLIQIISEAIPSGKEFISLDNLLFMDGFEKNDLMERGLLNYGSSSYEKPNQISSSTSRLLTCLRQELNNRKWLRKSIVDLDQFRHVEQIILQPVKFVEDSDDSKESNDDTLSFMVVNNKKEENDEFIIGINILNTVFKLIEVDPGKAPLLIPSILTGICQRVGSLSDEKNRIERNIEYASQFKFFLEKALHLYVNSLLFGSENYDGVEAEIHVG